jgi:hypothetical protein
MNVTSLTARTIETSLNQNEEAETLQLVNRIALPLLKILDHIGTSIALGEKGELEAADAYRRKNSGH